MSLAEAPNAVCTARSSPAVPGSGGSAASPRISGRQFSGRRMTWREPSRSRSGRKSPKPTSALPARDERRSPRRLTNDCTDGAIVKAYGIIEANDADGRDGRVVLRSGSGSMVIDGIADNSAIAAADIEIDGRVVFVRHEVEAQDDVRVAAKYVYGEDDGIIRAERLELASMAPATHPAGGTVSLAIDVDELAVGVSGADRSLFGQLELRNEGNLAVAQVGASSGINARWFRPIASSIRPAPVRCSRHRAARPWRWPRPTRRSWPCRSTAFRTASAPPTRP